MDEDTEVEIPSLPLNSGKEEKPKVANTPVRQESQATADICSYLPKKDSPLNCALKLNRKVSLFLTAVDIRCIKVIASSLRNTQHTYSIPTPLTCRKMFVLYVVSAM